MSSSTSKATDIDEYLGTTEFLLCRGPGGHPWRRLFPKARFIQEAAEDGSPIFVKRSKCDGCGMGRYYAWDQAGNYLGLFYDNKPDEFYVKGFRVPRLDAAEYEWTLFAQPPPTPKRKAAATGTAKRTPAKRGTTARLPRG